MLKAKEELEVFLNKETEKIAFNTEECEKIRNYLLERYDIPTGTTMDMVYQRVSLMGKTEFILFCLLDGIDYITGKENVKNFYTDMEIEQYSNTKLETDKIKFPIRIKCEQVAQDQWIGATNTQFFMNLRRDQLIKYNSNAQRVMKRIIKGESILFKITPNKKAISSIRTLMRNRQYIPTTITLNIPYASEANFYYDEKERELVIKSIKTFDISDGYHRYLAMCEEGDNTPDFNYPMEIRITNFEDEKTRQFIFQEDQKTKMAKTDSKSMDVNRYSNNVVDRLNESSTFNLKGQIGRNEGTIDYSSFSSLVEYFYFKNKKLYTNIDIINITNEIKQNLNALTEYNIRYINKIFNRRELAVIFYVFNKEQDKNKACQIIDEVLSSEDIEKIKKYTISVALFNEIENILQRR